VDISWLTGFGVAAILYYVLRPFFAKEAAAEVAPTS
jgi:cytosine/uracil/thiamine/allantoin permease